MGVVVCQDFSACRELYVNHILTEWEPELIDGYDGQEHVLKMKSGHRIRFVSAENPESLRGREKVAYSILDEIALYTRIVWDIVRGRLIDLVGPCVCATSPRSGPGHEWIKELYDIGLDPASELLPWDERFLSINMTSFDNPYLPEKELKNIASGYTAEQYKQEILGQFIDFNLNVFPKGLIQPKTHGYRIEELEKYRLVNYGTIDPAFSQNQVYAGSETAMLFASVAPDYGIFVRESWAARVNSYDMELKLMELADKYKPLRAFGSEKVAAQVVLAQNFRRAQSLGNTFPIIEITRSGGNNNKRTRAQAALPYVENHKIKFPVDDYGNWLGGCDLLIKQMEYFTGSKNELNDRVDTLSDLFNPQMGLVQGSLRPNYERPNHVANPVLSIKDKKRLLKRPRLRFA